VEDIQLTPKELDAFNLAKTQHYLVREPGHQQLENAYHQYCVSAQIYWISIHLHEDAYDNCNIGENHATFWYDLFHFRHGLTTQAFTSLKSLFKRARPGAYEYAESNLGEVGGYAIVPEYTAEKLAKAVVELFSNPDTHSIEMFRK
jgi:hypothetical protein